MIKVMCDGCGNEITADVDTMGSNDTLDLCGECMAEHDRIQKGAYAEAAAKVQAWKDALLYRKVKV